MPDALQDVLDPLLDRQTRSWLAGRRPSIAELLDSTPLCDDAEALLDLIYNEIVLRENLGEVPAEAEYALRYPSLRHELALHFEVHGAVRDPVLDRTACLGSAETLPEAAALHDQLWPELPDYEQLHLIGRGGMGVVYKARHRRLRRHVALKMFEPGRTPSPREVARFRAEADAVARLQHPNVVQIFEVGEWNGLPFLALELAEGGTLAERLQVLPFAPRAAATLIETLARAAHAAHDRGIVHRDLKPANVLFAADGTPKLTDFGLAKVLRDDGDAAHDATRTGEAIGTPRYMAPEQAVGRHDLAGPATDVYGLGTMLYECVTGRVPFVAASVVETLEMIRSAEPFPPRRLQPSMPRDLETICLKCLHKEPGRRYPTAVALAADLRAFLAGEPIAARPTPLWERGWKWCRRRPTRAALVAVATLLLAAGVAAAVAWDRHEQTRVAAARVEVDALVAEGIAALDRGEDEIAEARFREAALKVEGEPTLRDFKTGVAGWLDHSRRAANQQRWLRRDPPRDYDEKRDDALFLSLLLARPGVANPTRVARDAVAAAFELTLPDDAAWRPERERLTLLDATLVHGDAGAAAALAHLDGAAVLSSRLAHTLRAGYLDELGRGPEAVAERARAERLPPDAVAAGLFEGMDRFRRRDFAAAHRAFEAVLDADPAHFPARLAQAVCALELGRPEEAKVGLTACVAQRPRSAWAYFYRGRCAEKLGDPAGASRDFGHAAELQSRVPNQ